MIRAANQADAHREWARLQRAMRAQPRPARRRRPYGWRAVDYALFAIPAIAAILAAAGRAMGWL